jgi:hypothetical protein
MGLSTAAAAINPFSKTNGSRSKGRQRRHIPDMDGISHMEYWPSTGFPTSAPVTEGKTITHGKKRLVGQ